MADSDTIVGFNDVCNDIAVTIAQIPHDRNACARAKAKIRDVMETVDVAYLQGEIDRDTHTACTNRLGRLALIIVKLD